MNMYLTVRKITCFFVCFYGLMACKNEDMDGREVIPKVTPQIQLLFPSEEVVNVYSTATEYENTISNLWVLLFKADGETLDTLEFINVARIVKNGHATQLLPQLSFTPVDGRKIVCIANSDINTESALPIGITFSNINQKFTVKKNNYFHGGDTDHLPMYGEFIWGVSSGYTCTMTRAVAKIQVQMGVSVSDVTGNFSAETVSYTIHYAGNQGLIQPTPGAVSGVPRPSGSTFTRTHYLIQKQGATKRDTHVYIYEYPSSNKTGLDINTDIGNKTFHPERVHIILKKDNGPKPATYYRLDFYNQKEASYLDTKRNHHYMFTINEVRSEGYTSVTEAQNNPGSNIEYTIRVDNDSRQIKSNGQYAIAANIDTEWTMINTQQTANSLYLNDIGTVRYFLPSGMSTLGLSTNSITLELNEYAKGPGGGSNLSLMTLYSPSAPAVLTSSPQTITIGTATVIHAAKATLTFRLGNIIYQLPIKLCWEPYCNDPESLTFTPYP